MPPRFQASEVQPPRAWLRGAVADHLGRSLRAVPGEIVELTWQGAVHRASIRAVRRSEIEFELLASRPAAAPRLRIELAPAVFRFHRWEWLLEKAVELGVERVQPILARRTEPHLARAAGTRRERWQRLAQAAAEQSRRDCLPQVASPLGLQAYIHSLEPGNEQETRLWLREPAGDAAATASAPVQPLGHWLRRQPEITAPKFAEFAEHDPPWIRILSGPEGGWTAEECATLEAAGWLAVSLGPTVLRAETAPLAALAAVAIAR